MRWSRRVVVVVSGAIAAGGCARLHYENTTTVFDRPFTGSNRTPADLWFKTCYFDPGRDYLTFSWAGRALFGDEAWNVTPDGQVADGPFFVNRDVGGISPDEAGRGATTDPPPRGPWRIKKVKEKGSTPGFVGEDAAGRTFVVKLDDPNYPELGTGAEMIGARLYALLGYRVPATYLVTVENTGDADYDGKRATAAAFLTGKIVGCFDFDRYRLRREVRAIRLVAAWLNDTDRVDSNTLAAVEDGLALCYQLDFNSCLGSWNGRPKEAWRGWRYAWDVEYQLLGLATFGLLPNLPRSVAVPSPAVGSFDVMQARDPRAWRSQNPNTAFDRLTQSDAAWIAARMAAVTQAQLEAIVASAGYTNPQDAAAVLEMLLARRERVLQAWGCGGLLKVEGRR